MFLDESQNVKNKADARSSRSITSSSQSSTPNPEPRASRSDVSLPVGPSILPSDLTNDAIAFFLSNYAVDEGITLQARVHYFTDALTGISGDALLNTVHSVGLAGLSRSYGDPSLLSQARKCYLTAIQKTNLALTSSNEVKEDSTLLAVMTLSLFEATTGGNQWSLTAWSNHAHGAAALLSARGPEQFDSEDRLRLFVQVSISLANSCLSKSISLPPRLPILVASAAPHVNRDNPTWQFFESYVPFTDFFVKVKKKIISDPHLIIERAKELDKQVKAILANPVIGLGFRTVVTDADPDDVPLGYYYVYDTFLGAQTWNGIRTSRFMLNQMIRGVLLLGFSSQPPVFEGPEYMDQFRSSTETLTQLQNEVIASIPQYMGYASKPDHDQSKPRFLWTNFASVKHRFSPSLQHTHSGLPFTRVMGGYSFPWILHLIGDSDIATEAVRRRIIQTLRQISTEMAVQQAAILADALEKRLSPRSWFRKRAIL